MLIDPYGRTISNLRIAVTNRCNLRCIYCHREGESGGGELPAERIAEIAEAFLNLGVRKVKITGGEPLLRDDICDIVAMLEGFDEVSMTTNGTMLAEKAYELKESGLRRVNISLDTLNAEKYEFITGSDALEDVIAGVEAARDAGLEPIKLNMVVMKGVNEDEVDELLNFAKSVGAILQLIELVPVGKMKDYYFNISRIEEKYALAAYEVRVRAMHRRRQYVTPRGVIEFVKPLDNSEFCLHCNRIRVTSDGKVKPCLLSDAALNLEGLRGDELVEAIKRAVSMRRPRFASLAELTKKF